MMSTLLCYFSKHYPTVPVELRLKIRSGYFRKVTDHIEKLWGIMKKVNLNDDSLFYYPPAGWAFTFFLQQKKSKQKMPPLRIKS